MNRIATSTLLFCHCTRLSEAFEHAFDMLCEGGLSRGFTRNLASQSCHHASVAPVVAVLFGEISVDILSPWLTASRTFSHGLESLGRCVFDALRDQIFF